MFLQQIFFVSRDEALLRRSPRYLKKRDTPSETATKMTLSLPDPADGD
jgi:hypothetical protein